MTAPTAKDPGPSETPQPIRRRWRWLLLLFLGAVLSLALFLGALAALALAWLDTPPGKQWLVATVNNQLADSGVRISGLQGRLLGAWQLERVELFDTDGAYLTLEEVEVAWRPMALFDGLLAIDAISADSARLSRLPAGEETDEPPAAMQLPRLPELPIDVALERLVVARIAIAEPALGMAATLGLDGGAHWVAGDRIRLDLALTRLDTPGDRLSARVDYDQGAGTLDLEADLLGEPGGLFATALGAAPEDPAELRLEGTGPLGDWSGTLSARLGAGVRLDAAMASDGSRVFLDGEAELGRLLAEPYAAFTRPAIGVVLSADLGEAGRLPLTLALTTPSAELQSEGALLLGESDSVDLTYEVAVEDSEAVRSVLGDTARFAALRADGRIEGPLAGPRLETALRVEQVRLPDGPRAERVRLDATASLADETVRLSGTGGLVRLVLPDMEPLDPELEFDLAYTGDSGNIAVDRLRLAAAGGILETTGRVNADGGQLALETRLAVPRLGALPRAGALPVSGGFGAELTFERTAADAPLAITLTAAGEELSTQDETLAGLLGARPSLTARAELTPETLLRLDSFDLDAPGLRLTAAGPVDLAGESLDLTYEARMPELGRLLGLPALDLEGGLSLTGAVNGAFEDLAGDARTEIPHIDLQGVDLVDVVLEMRGRDLTGRPAGELTLNAESGYGAIAFDASATMEADGAIDIPRLRLTAGTAELAGQLRLTSAGLIEGEITGGTGELAELPESRRYGIRGDLSLAAQLNGDGAGHQRIAVEADGEKLLVPLGGTEILEIEALALDGVATLMAPRPRIEAEVSLTDAAAGFARLESASIAASGNAEALEVDLAADGDWRGPLDLTGRLRLSGGDTQRVVLGLDGTLFGQAIATPEPAVVTLSEAGWQLEPLLLRLGEGRLTGAAERADGYLKGELTAQSLPLELLNVAVPTLYPSGTLGGEITLRQDEVENGGARVDLALRLRDVEPAVGGFADTPAFNLDMDGRLADGRLDLSGSAESPGTTEARFALGLPLTLDLVGEDTSLPTDAPIEGRFDWSGALAPAFMLVNLPEHEAYGDLAAEMRLAGTLADPKLDGEVTISEARYEHLASGFIARDLVFAARLDDRRVELERLSAGDGDGGRLEGSGWVAFPADGPLLADISLNLDRLHLLRRVDVKATASGALTFESTAEAMAAGGNLRPDRVDVDIGRKLPEGVVDIEVIEVRTAGEEGEDDEAERDADEARPLKLDLNVNAPRRLFVRGRGLDSEWGANLTIRGTAEAPRLAGRAQLVRGVFEFASTRFSLDEGELLFAGGEDIDPAINLTASEQIEDLDVTLDIGGRASAPTVSFSSIPSLPEDEILARILFGSSIADLSALQLVQLASAVSGLAGGGGFDIFATARGALGLDRLTVETGNGAGNGEEEDSGPVVAGGKYVADNVYLEVATETGTGVSSGMLEWSLTKNLSIRSRVSSGRDNSVRVRWSWNY